MSVSSCGALALLIVATICVFQTSATYVTFDQLDGKPYTVTWDNRSLMINGERTLLLGGSFHYTRASEGDWAQMFAKARADGLNHIETYIFWNYHEFTQGLYDFSGRGNLSSFISQAAQAGLFVNLRMGPYIDAEWNYGGLPVWLNWVSNIDFRASNTAWEGLMSSFLEEISTIIEQYLPKNGGNVILAQIENEFSFDDNVYVDWCGNLTTTLDLGIPWLMCNGYSAPQTINTCNGNQCGTSYAPSHANQYPTQPLMWTEDEGWFEQWSQPSDQPTFDNRSPQEMAYVIAQWFAVGGAHHNYYMWYGGNHIGRWASSGITNMYADGTNYHSDTTANEPKHSHLVKLHNIMAQYSDVLLDSPSQINNGTPVSLNQTLEVASCILPVANMVYVNNTLRAPNNYCVVGVCGEDCYPAVFAPCDGSSSQHWTYNANFAFVNQESGSCLDIYESSGPQVGLYGCTEADNQAWTIFSNNNTIKANLQNKDVCMGAEQVVFAVAFVYEDQQNSSNSLAFVENIGNFNLTVDFDGNSYFIPTGSISIISDGNELFNTAIVNTTDIPSTRVYTDVTQPGELVWSYFSEVIPPTQGPFNITTTPVEQLLLTQDRTEYLYYLTDIVDLPPNALISWNGWKANSYSIFIDNVLVGNVFDYEHSTGEIAYQFTIPGGYDGPHVLTIVSGSLGLNCGVQPGPGNQQEKKGIIGAVTIQGLTSQSNWFHRVYLLGEILNVYGNPSAVTWTPVNTTAPITNALTWFQTSFAMPPANGAVVVNVAGLSRGHFYINGVDMGRYWSIQQDGKYVQQYYYVPRDMLQATNTLIIIDELGVSDITQATIALVTLQ